MSEYNPTGTRFYDQRSDREMMLVGCEEPQAGWRGWILYRHPDGQWVSLRKATDADRAALEGEKQYCPRPYWHEWREVWTATGLEFRCAKCNDPMPITFASGGSGNALKEPE